MGEGDNTVTMDPAVAEAAGRARVDLDAKRKRTAEAWMAFEKRRDQLTKQEAQPTDQEASELQALHATYQAAANAEDEAVNNWLDAIDGNGNGKTGTFIRHKRTGRAGGAVSKAVIDALDAKTLVAPQGAFIAPDVLELIVSKARRPHSVLGLVSQARTDEVGNISASGIAINPADYWTMLAVREGGTTGPYLLGDLTAAGPTTLWGVPVVRSTAIAAGQAIIAHWSQAVLVVRDGTTIAWADAHTDLFVRNQVILRVESRVAFYVARPTAFAIADLTALTRP